MFPYQEGIEINELSKYGSLAPYINESLDSKNFWRRITRISKEDIIKGAVVAGVAVGGVLLHAVGGAAIGAICGEILDNIPYFGSSIQDTLNTILHTNYFTGNLDKLGATLGFVGGFFKGKTYHKD